jgi:hypothetical protein
MAGGQARCEDDDEQHVLGKGQSQGIALAVAQEPGADYLAGEAADDGYNGWFDKRDAASRHAVGGGDNIAGHEPAQA